MDHLVSEHVERLIGKVFDAVVPHKQYKVISADEPVACQRSVVHVHELPQGYVTPFSDEEYDYMMQAIKACQYPLYNDFNAFVTTAVRLGLAYEVTDNTSNFLWPYLMGSRIYEQVKGPILNMRAFVATYGYMGWPATADYEY